LKKDNLILKGRTVFIVAVIAIVLTVLTVFIAGINYNRSLGSNLFISLGIISASLFSFLSYAFYRGTKLVDDYPKFRNYSPGTIMERASFPDFGINTDDGISGFLLSLILWLLVTIGIVVLLLLFETLLWFSFFIIFASLYWLFSRALRLAFYKSRRTRGDLPASIVNALTYTALYTGWLFGIAVIIDLLK